MNDSPSASFPECWKILLNGLASQLAIREALERFNKNPSDANVALLYFFAARRASAATRTLAEVELPTASSEYRFFLRWVWASVRLRNPAETEALPELLDLEGEARNQHRPHLLLPILTDLGYAFATRGDAVRAIESFEEALALARHLNLRFLEAFNLLNLGFCYAEKEQPLPYAAHTREALQIFETLSDANGIAMSHNNLAGALQKLGELEEARSHYACAEALAAQHGMTGVEALCKAGRGGIALKLGEIEEGEALYSASNLLLEGNSFQINRHFYLVGSALLSLGHLERAAVWLEKAVEGARAKGFRQTLSLALLEWSKVEEQRGNLQASVTILHEYIDLSRVIFEEHLKNRLHLAQLRATLDATRQQALHARKRAEELSSFNAELAAALEAQRQLQEQLQLAARTDPLTGLWNRRHLREWLDAEIARIHRHPSPLCIAILDVDHFKKINDTYGHPVGDQVLIRLSEILKTSLRAGDLVARWGGEEICVVFPDTPLACARIAMEHLRKRVAEAEFSAGELRIQIRFSAGVAAFREEERSIEEALKRADQALYLAKQAGRNQVLAEQ